VIWSGDDGVLTASDLALLSRLRLASENGELSLAYQPQVSTKTMRIVSAEALLRWDSDSHGRIPPGAFIPLAEHTGLIDRLTEWVMREALDAQVRWRRSGFDIPVSVNLSATSLTVPDLAPWILSELQERHLPIESHRGGHRDGGHRSPPGRQASPPPPRSRCPCLHRRLRNGVTPRSPRFPISPSTS
jgi:hypothetical protein